MTGKHLTGEQEAHRHSDGTFGTHDRRDPEVSLGPLGPGSFDDPATPVTAVMRPFDGATSSEPVTVDVRGILDNYPTDMLFQVGATRSFGWLAGQARKRKLIPAEIVRADVTVDETAFEDYLDWRDDQTAG